MAKSGSILPGFRSSFAFTMGYLLLIVLLPLAACIAKACTLTWPQYWAAVSTDRAVAAYKLTIWVSLVSGFLSSIVGLVVAWVLVRYQFFGKRFFDAIVDLPFALPTAVAGLVFSSLYVKNGWFGRYLVPLGFEGAYSQTAIVMVLLFIGFPFVVRSIQPVLEELDPELEEAAVCLGASRWQIFRHVIFPHLWPALVTGFALSFARGMGEYGSVVFVSGNMPFKTEIAPYLIVARLEGYAYAEAAAIATVLLGLSFVMLAVINFLERWSKIGDVSSE